MQSAQRAQRLKGGPTDAATAGGGKSGYSVIIMYSTPLILTFRIDLSEAVCFIMGTGVGSIISPGSRSK